MSVIVLSCADNNERPINYSNETVKNNEIELSKLEEKKTIEDKIPELTVKQIKTSSNVNTFGKKLENKNPVIEFESSSILIQNKNSTSIIEHEATTSKINEDQLFYCNQRGLDQEEAVSLIVNGFCKEVLQQLPMEFAVEAQKLVSISLEGSVG